MAPSEAAPLDDRTAVIVLTWNDVDHTLLCVESIRNHSSCEIVVVDNGSEPDLAAELRRALGEHDVTLIRSDENLGYGRGMNLGVRGSERPLIILSNNDVQYDDQAIQMLAAAIERDKVGMAVPRLVDLNRVYSGGTTPLPSLKRALARCFFVERLVRVDPGRTWRQGAVVAVRRSVLDAIGGVSERSFMYAEDLRLCAAVLDRQLEIVEVDQAVAQHVDDASASRLWSEERIGSEQVEQLVIASVDVLGGWRGRLFADLFTLAALERLVLRPSRRRYWIVRSAFRARRSFQP